MPFSGYFHGNCAASKRETVFLLPFCPTLAERKITPIYVMLTWCASRTDEPKHTHTAVWRWWMKPSPSRKCADCEEEPDPSSAIKMTEVIDQLDIQSIQSSSSVIMCIDAMSLFFTALLFFFLTFLVLCPDITHSGPKQLISLMAWIHSEVMHFSPGFENNNNKKKIAEVRHFCAASSDIFRFVIDWFPGLWDRCGQTRRMGNGYRRTNAFPPAFEEGGGTRNLWG